MASQLVQAPDETVRDTIDDILKLSTVREEAKTELQELLESFRGRKALVVDLQLSGLLSQILPENSKKFLETNGVYSVVDLIPEAMQNLIETYREVPENVIYLIRSHLPNMKVIAAHINFLARTGLLLCCIRARHVKLFIVCLQNNSERSQSVQDLLRAQSVHGLSTTPRGAHREP